MTYVRQVIPFSETRVFKERSLPGPIEAQGIRVRRNHGSWLTLVNVYWPWQRPLLEHARLGEWNDLPDVGQQTPTPGGGKSVEVEFGGTMVPG